MKSELKAVVIGAGWAGEGHTKAMQSVGVEVTSSDQVEPTWNDGFVSQDGDGLSGP